MYKLGYAGEGLTKVKTIIGGDQGTGKTRIFRSLFQMPLSAIDIYYPTHEPQINTINFSEIELEVWDLPGYLLDNQNNNLSNIFQNVGGAILIFDITRMATFESIARWIEKTWTYSPGAPIVLVANKIDLAPTSTDSRKILDYSQNFIDSINKNTSYYCKIIQITATKEKNAYKIFNELLVAIQFVKGKNKTDKDILLTELESKVKLPINNAEVYEKPKFANENKILTKIEEILSNATTNTQPATIQKMTYFLKNNREIRTVFMHLKQYYVDELIASAQDPNWLTEENFLYLIIYKFLEQTLTPNINSDELTQWITKFTELFLNDRPSFLRFIELHTITAVSLLQGWINNPKLIIEGGWDMEIYVAYREEIYTE